MNQNESNLEKDISTYLKMKWPVIPLHYPKTPKECSCGKLDCGNIGKHPRTEHGLKDATLDEKIIETWQRRWNFFNVGVLTSNLIVVDVDPRHGGDDSLYDLEKKWARFPDTVITLTGGGGQHFFFKALPEKKIKNKVGLAPGLDIRANGGYVVAPHSLHKSGRNYYFEAGFGPGEIEIADAPPWLLSMLGASNEPTSQSDTYWKKFVSTEIVEGFRDETLASTAGYLLRRYVDPFLVLDLLQAWNHAKCRPPLDSSVVVKVVNSIAGIELKRREHGESR